MDVAKSMMFPVEFRWDGKAMIPLPRFNALVRKQYTINDTYFLSVHEERSTASHRHYFACINEAWRNLPEKKVATYPTPEHLRKWALVRAGYYNERSIVCTSDDQADAVIAMIEALDEYAVIVAKKGTVKVFTAISQSVDNMTKEKFERSKQDVLAVLSEVIGVTTQQLEKQGRESDV